MDHLAARGARVPDAPRWFSVILALLFLTACGGGTATPSTAPAAPAAAPTTAPKPAATSPPAAVAPTIAPVTQPTAPTKAAAATPVSGEIVVFAASSLTDSFQEMAAAFRQTNPNARLTFNFGASTQLATQLGQGASADAFASADQ